MIQHTFHPAEKTLQLTIPGDLLRANAESIKAEALAILGSAEIKSAGWTVLKLDLTSARMVDSVGLNLVVFLFKEAKKANARTAVVISDKNIQRTFLFTRLNTHLDVIMADGSVPQG